MHDMNRAGIAGAILLALSLIGYVIYQAVLYPAAGFPTEDFGVVVAGANTLRVGHLLKFGYAIGIALLLVGLYTRAQSASPLLAQLAAISAIAAATIYISSGMLGLRILEVAEQTFTAKQSEAITTILLRSVTVALFEAGILVTGFFSLLISLALLRARALPAWLAYLGILLGILFIIDRVLFDPLHFVAPFLAILWSLGLAFTLAAKPAEPNAPSV
jgi:hypothetical protein